MRHLSPAELLLYAEGELADRALCQHLLDCVDCKASLVDLQESYVLSARALREHLPPGPPGHDQLVNLRARMAADAQLRAMHLSTEDLMLSLEGRIDDSCEAHLSACESCRSRASKLHAELAAIEFELRRQPALNVPVERRAAALEELRGRIDSEIASRRPPASVIGFPMPALRPLASYGAALAAACALVWVGWQELAPRPVSEPTLTAEVQNSPAAAPSPIPAPTLPAAYRPEAASPQPQRFTQVPARLSRRPAAVALLDPLPAPVLNAAQPADALMAAGSAEPVEAPALAAALGEPELATAARAVPAESGTDDPDLVAEGSLMLVRSGLWNSGLRAGGAGETVRFIGALASEAERSAAQRALLAVAGPRSIEFEIAVGSSALADGSQSVSQVAWRQGTLGGPVRNALVQHYRDAARRSFQQPAPALLQSELDRYVSSVMRHDAELLSHVHALHKLLTSVPVAGSQPGESLRQVARFHLDGIGRHQAGLSGQLSESLPRRFWAYGGARRHARPSQGVEPAAEQLLDDALALDQVLAALFFGSGASLDARASNLSAADLLGRIRQHTRQLRAAIR